MEALLSAFTPVSSHALLGVALPLFYSRRETEAWGH